MNLKKPLLALVVFMVGSLGLTTSFANEKPEPKPTNLTNSGDVGIETQHIEKLLKSYFAALNKSDAKTAVAAYAKDGIFMPTEGPTATGLEQLKTAYQHVFDTIKLNVSFKIDEIVLSGAYAYAITSSDGEVTILGKGVTAPEKNRELFVLKKVDGDWKIARYMFNKSSRPHS